MNETTSSFKENYATLKQVAETLRAQQEPDIDALVPMVDKAMASYKICKARIEAVKRIFADKQAEAESQS